MAAYFHKRIKAVVAAKGEEHWQRVLEIEFGGMNDVSGQENARGCMVPALHIMTTRVFIGSTCGSSGP